MPPTQSTIRRPLLIVVALAALLLPALMAGPVEAHGTKWGTAADARSTGLDIYLDEYDLSQDGHCARGRFHLSGKWVTVATDCSHSPASSGVFSGYYGATGTISVSSCLSGHNPSSNTCHYGQYQTFGRIDLGAVP